MNVRRFLLVLPVLGSMVLCGCYKANAVEAFLDGSGNVTSALEYRVYPPDVISLQSTFVPEINGIQQTIRPDGAINLPLLGEVQVAGKTSQEIEEAIREAAKNYYEEVDVRVQVEGYNSQNFYVLGQVSRSGPVPWTGRDSLLEVLARAMPTQEAWPERIAVIRPTGPQVGGYMPKKHAVYYRATGIENADPDKRPIVMTVNYKAMIQSGDLSKNILLRPNDIVYVEANPFAKVAMAVSQAFSPVRAINNGFSDYRNVIENLRWLQEGQLGSGAGQSQLVTRP